MASFSETLDLAEEEEILYLILLRRRRRRRRKRLWSVRPKKQRREERGKNVLVSQMRKMDEEQHFWYFRMSKYRFDDHLLWITPYIQLQNTHSNLFGVSQRPAVALQIIWVITTVCSGSRSSKPSILQVYFPLLSK